MQEVEWACCMAIGVLRACLTYVLTLAEASIALCSAAGSPDGIIASASEDNTARLWRPDGTCLQPIEHPGCVWDVAFLPNGDLVTACSDYVARIWTRAGDRRADTSTIEVRAAGRSRNPPSMLRLKHLL